MYHLNNRLLIGGLVVLVFSVLIVLAGCMSHNQPPRAEFRYQVEETSCDIRDMDSIGCKFQIKWDASLSKDPDGEIVEYRWNFRDEDQSPTTKIEPSSSFQKKPEITVTFQDLAKIKATLTVTDNDGASAENEQSIILGPIGIHSGNQ